MSRIHFIDKWLDIPVLRAETSTHSANFAALRRDSSGAALGLVLDMPVVQRGAQFACRGVDICVVAQMQIPMVPLFRKT